MGLVGTLKKSRPLRKATEAPRWIRLNTIMMRASTPVRHDRMTRRRCRRRWQDHARAEQREPAAAGASQQHNRGPPTMTMSRRAPCRRRPAGRRRRDPRLPIELGIPRKTADPYYLKRTGRWPIGNTGATAEKSSPSASTWRGSRALATKRRSATTGTRIFRTSASDRSNPHGRATGRACCPAVMIKSPGDLKDHLFYRCRAPLRLYTAKTHLGHRHPPARLRGYKFSHHRACGSICLISTVD